MVAIVTELRKLGATVEEFRDYCVITPPKEVREHFGGHMRKGLVDGSPWSPAYVLRHHASQGGEAGVQRCSAMLGAGLCRHGGWVVPGVGRRSRGGSHVLHAASSLNLPLSLTSSSHANRSESTTPICKSPDLPPSLPFPPSLPPPLLCTGQAQRGHRHVRRPPHGHDLLAGCMRRRARHHQRPLLHPQDLPHLLQRVRERREALSCRQLQLMQRHASRKECTGISMGAGPVPCMHWTMADWLDESEHVHRTVLRSRCPMGVRWPALLLTVYCSLRCIQQTCCSMIEPLSPSVLVGGFMRGVGAVSRCPGERVSHATVPARVADCLLYLLLFNVIWPLATCVCLFWGWQRTWVLPLACCRGCLGLSPCKAVRCRLFVLGALSFAACLTDPQRVTDYH